MEAVYRYRYTLWWCYTEVRASHIADFGNLFIFFTLIVPLSSAMTICLAVFSHLLLSWSPSIVYRYISVDTRYKLLALDLRKACYLYTKLPRKIHILEVMGTRSCIRLHVMGVLGLTIIIVYERFCCPLKDHSNTQR